MRVTKVEPHEVIDVPGFEYHSFECPGCGENERRLLFNSERPRGTEDAPATAAPTPENAPADNRSFFGRTISKLLRS
jgi:hypothetical protein